MKKINILALTLLSLVSITSCGIEYKVSKDEFLEKMNLIKDESKYIKVSTSGRLNTDINSGEMNVPLNFNFKIEEGLIIFDGEANDLTSSVIKTISPKIEDIYKVTDKEENINTYHASDSSYKIESLYEDKEETKKDFKYNFNQFGYLTYIEETITFANKNIGYNSKLILSVNWQS